MKYPKGLKSVFLASFLAMFLMTDIPNTVAAGNVNWQKYMTSAAVVSAIAATIAMASPCSKPLKFDETREDGKLSLLVSCPGNGEEEATAVIEFKQIPDGPLVPSRYDFAG